MGCAGASAGSSGAGEVREPCLSGEVEHVGEGAGVEEAAQEGAVGQVPVGDVHLVRQRRRLPRPLQRHRVVVVEVVHAQHPCTRAPAGLTAWCTTRSNRTGRRIAPPHP